MAIPKLFRSSNNNNNDNTTNQGSGSSTVTPTSRSSVPPHFICPLSKRIMTCPMETVHGTVFEKTAIQAWFQQGKTTCPVTEKNLKPSQIVHHLKLQEEIQKWHDNEPIRRCTESRNAKVHRTKAPPTLLSLISIEKQKGHGSSSNSGRTKSSNSTISSLQSSDGVPKTIKVTVK